MSSILDRRLDLLRLLRCRLGGGRAAGRLGRPPRGPPLPGLLRSLASPRVGARALTADGQSLAVSHATVAAEVHQPLDAHGHLAAQIALDRVPADKRERVVPSRVAK